MGRILVIRGGALGDFILTLPVLAALREQFPGARLETLGYPHIARLALHGGMCDALHPVEARPLAGFFARRGSLDETFASYFESFDVIVSYLYDPDEIFRENVARCSRAQFIVGPHRPDERGDTHAVDTFLQPLQRLAIFAAGAVPRLDIPGLPPGPGPWLAVHPGSGSETKNWPEQRWLELIRRVTAQTGFRLLLLGGEAEGDRLDRLAEHLPPNQCRVARSRPIEEVAGLLRGCSTFIGHDSGITHLAAAVGLPVLALWGPSNATLWRPRGSDIVLVRCPVGLKALTVDDVWEHLLQRLASIPRSNAGEPAATADLAP